MDSSLKDLERRLEQFVPRGMSDEGLSRVNNLIDELSERPPVSSSPIGLSWKVTSIAAAIVLSIGLTSGWWFGQVNDAGPVVKDVIPEPAHLVTAFKLIDERSWMEIDESPEIVISSAGEVLEVATEIDVSEETVIHRESGNYITIRVLTRQPVERVTDQF